MDVNEFKKSIAGEEVVVIGIGVSNIQLIKFLTENGANVIAHDRRNIEQLGDIYHDLEKLGVKFVLGDTYLDKVSSKAKTIYKTPGVRKDVPVLKKASENGVKVTSEMELFFELCPAKIISVTGSDGKTTTTSLIYDMITRAGYNCYLGGNIGTPLIGEIDKIKSDDVVVLELSSFQLHTMHKSADVAVVTNVTPNHLDWHTDFQEYIDSKKAIFSYQNLDGKVILNYDNEITRNFASETNNFIYFSSKNKIENGYRLDGNMITFAENGNIKREVLDVRDIYIPGMHNVENYMAAIAATNGMVNDEIIRKTAKEFKGVPHRIEFVREVLGVKYYNDSIASSPARTTAGLSSFDDKVILIAGGYDKKIPFDDFGAVVNENVKKLVLCGLTAGKIKAAVTNATNFENLPIFECNDFEEAINTAKNIAEPGDTVILSPACASFDLFKNFEERGNTFKDIVNSLIC
ncbi:MAG: UDP-N-acetylmuramoyl-L-alanine--D-glutamate ligase [Oscillospiraceae bacterium]